MTEAIDRKKLVEWFIKIRGKLESKLPKLKKPAVVQTLTKLLKMSPEDLFVHSDELEKFYLVTFNKATTAQASGTASSLSSSLSSSSSSSPPPPLLSFDDHIRLCHSIIEENLSKCTTMDYPSIQVVLQRLVDESTRWSDWNPTKFQKEMLELTQNLLLDIQEDSVYDVFVLYQFYLNKNDVELSLSLFSPTYQLVYC